VTVTADGGLRVAVADLDPGAPLGDPDCAGEAFAGFQAFLRSAEGRTAPVKLQVTGPVTFARALHAGGAPAELALAVAGRAVRHRAAAMVAAASERLPGADLVVFVDEPALVGLTQPESPFTTDESIDQVSAVLAGLERRTVTGLHCCGRADWRALLATGPQILSLPVAAAADLLPADAGAFLERGGWIAWGVVPTDGPRSLTPDRLWRRLCARWCDLVAGGCDPWRLRTQALVTPACGLAHHSEAQAGEVLDQARAVADRLRDQLASGRVTVGA
jgi:methionine synthase II (cobalamin-independent)